MQINNLIKFEKIFLYLILGVFGFLILTQDAFAATPTASKEKISSTPSPSNSEIPKSTDIEKIQRIKDLVASKVAELNLVEKRGIIGTIREVTNMKIAITDIKGSIRQIDVDELTKFNITKAASGISDLEKGKMYAFIGLYNKDTKKLLARVINNTNTIPVHFEGAVTSIDSKSYQITAVDQKGVTKKIDIESSTKTNLADSEGDLTKSGFSKLETNKRILAIGFADQKDKDLITALRLIHFESVPPSKEMQSHVKIGE